MRGSELDRGELLRPEGLRRGSVQGRPVVLVVLLVVGVVRDARVCPHLYRMQIRDVSVLTVVIQDI